MLKRTVSKRKRNLVRWLPSPNTSTSSNSCGVLGADAQRGARKRCQKLAVPTDRRMPEAAAAAALFAALPRAAGLVGGLGAPGAQLCILAADAHFSACALCGSPGQSCAHGLHGTAPAHTGSPLPTNCPGNMSRVEAAAATRDYALKPRLEYRTVAGVNGPLVILEVRRRPCAQHTGSARVRRASCVFGHSGCPP